MTIEYPAAMTSGPMKMPMKPIFNIPPHTDEDDPEGNSGAAADQQRFSDERTIHQFAKTGLAKTIKETDISSSRHGMSSPANHDLQPTASKRRDRLLQGGELFNRRRARC
jgi:hypothetical protein